MRRKVER
jgi:hypothetical protein